MSEEKSRIETNIYLTQEDVTAGQAVLDNGTILKITAGTDEGGEFNEFEMVPHPGVELAVGLFKKAGKDQSYSTELIVEGLTLLAAIGPNMQMKDLWHYLVQAFPVQVTTIVTRATLGIDRPVEEKQTNGSGSPANGEQQLVVNFRPQINIPEAKKQAPPVINFNPQINVPKQDAPIVNVNPKLEMPPQREQKEITTIERDSNGFIRTATKIRQPIG